MSAADIPLASYAEKWSAAHPELGMALRYEDEARRPVVLALAALGHELAQAAYGIRDAEPAIAKLHWWSEEMSRATRGEARHPLARALAADARFTAVPLADWHATIAGAFAQRDPEPAADLEALLAGHARLFRPLARIEARFSGVPDDEAEAIARAAAIGRALRDTAAMHDALRDGRLPVPLDRLARHRLARGDLARGSPEQSALLREWLADLAAALARLRLVAPLHAASASADRWRAESAARDARPLDRLRADLPRLPMRAVWSAWSAARRQRREASSC